MKSLRNVPEGASLERNLVSVLITSYMGSYVALAPREGSGTHIKRPGRKKKAVETFDTGDLRLALTKFCAEFHGKSQNFDERRLC